MYSSSNNKYNFFSIFSHSIMRIATAVPFIKLANVTNNLNQTITLIDQACKNYSIITVFPELSLCGSSLGDLFQQKVIIDTCHNSLSKIIDYSINFNTIIIIGLPILYNNLIYNCAAVIYKGKILGIIPKSHIAPWHQEYESRYFTTANYDKTDLIKIHNEFIPFGNNLIFVINCNKFELAFYIEIGDTIFSPLQKSTFAALSGANVIINISSSSYEVGNYEIKKNLLAAQSLRICAGYVYTSSGFGESTTDLNWRGHSLSFQVGKLLTEQIQTTLEPFISYTELDLDVINSSRFGNSSFKHHSNLYNISNYNSFKKINIDFDLGKLTNTKVFLINKPSTNPYLPVNKLDKNTFCKEIFENQVNSLITRIIYSGIQNLVIGVSGGIDSTLALFVCIKALEKLNLPKSNIKAYTLPGFATSYKTKSNAIRLMKLLNINFEEISIIPSCIQMLKDIRHPYAYGNKIYDTTFENVQAGERASHLFRLANLHNGIVIGTGDLSEIALGWCTYGVGDHISHYNVNASIPKTVIREILRWIAENWNINEEVKSTINEILITKISPELIPSETINEDIEISETINSLTEDKNKKQMPSDIQQASESVVGPFDLQDFNIFYAINYGFPPSKIAFLALNAFSKSDSNNNLYYSLKEIKNWLRVFITRFYGVNSQFKRSCSVDGPKTAFWRTLSPRTDWKVPSDSDYKIWLEDLENNIPDLEE